MSKGKAVLLLIVLVLVVSGVYAAIQNIMHPTAFFESGHSTVSFESKAYSLGDTISLRVSVEAGVKAAIISIKLISVIEGWENQTLFSGGSKYWGSTITYKSGDEGYDSEYAVLVMPYSKESADDVIKAEIEVYYVYASPTGGQFFENIWKTDIVKIDIKVKE